jgi:DNA-binding transcriptional regulator GbsR (MarR family)
MTDTDPEEVREEVVEALERAAEMYGLNRSGGRVWGVLYFAEAPLSMAELVERTGYAKSTVSTVTRQLDRVGLVRRRSGDGRRINFEARMDVWVVLQDVYHQFARREMEATTRTLERAERRLGDDGPTVERVRSLRARYEELQRLFDLLSQFTLEELLEVLAEHADDPPE